MTDICHTQLMMDNSRSALLKLSKGLLTCSVFIQTSSSLRKAQTLSVILKCRFHQASLLETEWDQDFACFFFKPEIL